MGESCYEPLLYQTDFSNMSCCPLLLKYLRIHVIRLRTSVVSAVIRSKRLALLLLIPYYCVIKGETIAIDCDGSMTRLRLGIDSRNSVYGVCENQRRRLSRLKLSLQHLGARFLSKQQHVIPIRKCHNLLGS